MSSPGPWSKSGNFKITNGSIQDSEIDMNYRKITSVQDPTAPYDAVNKRTLEQSIPGTAPSVYNVTLTGTQTSVLTGTGTTGSYNMFIRSVADPVNGPSLRVSAGKNRDSAVPSIRGSENTPGLTSQETICVRWPAGQEVQIFKSGNNYDGTFRVVVQVEPR